MFTTSIPCNTAQDDTLNPTHAFSISFVCNTYMSHSILQKSTVERFHSGTVDPQDLVASPKNQ